MKAKCTRGFGLITDPETGDEIDVQDTFEVEKEVFDRLKANYPGIEVVALPSEPPDSEGEDAPVESDNDHPTNEEGEPLCVGKDDGQCSRVVEEPGGRCWQHPLPEE